MDKINAESIIFDLDGTLWDSADNVAMSWNTVIDELNIPRMDEIYISGDELRNTMGMPMDELARHFFPTLSEKSQINMLRKCMAFENEYVAEHGGTIYSGEEETLKLLAENHSGFGKYFSGYACWGDTGLQKSMTIRLLMKKYSCKSAVYVGDTDGDCKSALKADIPFVHAAYGFGEISDRGNVTAYADSFSGYLHIF